SGDPQVAEAARLMRLPGSHNTRVEGERLPVTIADNSGRTYELDELVDHWLEAQPILPKRIRPEKANGHAGVKGHDKDGVKKPLDDDAAIDKALDEMGYKVAGDEVHWTQLRVTCRLTSEGCPVEETVERVLTATRGAEPRDEKWDWAKEENKIWWMCFDW